MKGAFALAALLAVSMEQDTFQFRVEVNQVYVDVFVSRNGEPVTDLTANHFEVYDNGKRQNIALMDASSAPHSIALLVDNSASISGQIDVLLNPSI